MNVSANTLVVVTGGGSGMGEATARHFAGLGASVVILDRDIAKAGQVAEDIKALALECDVSDASSVEAAFEQVSQQPGALRLCVNCAGIAPAKKILGRDGIMALDDFSKVININLIGTFNVSRMAASVMAQQELSGEERGLIVNTASVAAYEGQVGQSAYSASKGGVVAMTLPMARELAREAIRVNTIAPGLVATPMLSAMPEDLQKSLYSAVPFPKRFGHPEEYAKLVAHLFDNTMINGEVIRFDGALRMQPK